MIKKYNFDRPLLCFSINHTYDYDQKHNKATFYTPNEDKHCFFQPKDISRCLGFECDFGFAKGESNVFMKYLYPDRPHYLSIYSKWVKAFRLSSSYVEKNQIMEPFDYFESLFKQVKALFMEFGVTKDKLLHLQEKYIHQIRWEFNLYFVQNDNLYGHISLENLKFMAELGADFNIYLAGNTEKLILSKFM